MPEITYSDDETIDESLPKPTPYGSSYPYTELSPRNFETFVYLLIKNEIEFGGWGEQYNNISLMQGVRDKGRDCCLRKDGKNTGVIQCKKYSQALTKDVCAKEIIKFVLHYILERSLINDIANFNYYLVAPVGFKDEATDLLDDFNNAVFLDQNFDKWIKAVLKENEAFAALQLASIETILHKVLRSVKIKKIIGADMDLLLEKEQNANIVRKMFSVKGVSDNETVIARIDELESSILASKPSAMSLEEILDTIEAASHYLFNYPNSFSTSSSIHVDRQITTELYNWLRAPLDKDKPRSNVTMVAGNAGTGKSVVLKDLCAKLKSEGIPVLGIKADRINAEDVESLQKKMNLPEPLDKLVRKLSEIKDLVVICIDQIDALSQSLSNKRDYMATFDILISGLRLIKNVRIIISTRTYDLQYDPSMQYYKDQKIFTLQKLSPEELKDVLFKAGIAINELHSVLRELLRNPNELSVFLTIYSPELSLTRLNTLYDLYNELWKQKLKVEGVPEILYSIAETMYRLQSIAIPVESFTSSEDTTLVYCIRENIVNSSHGLLQFFHQTFYDFVFAKRFTEGNLSVEQYVLENGNGLFIRSCLRMILSFMSASNHPAYISINRRILYSRKYFFHIKLLTLQSLGMVELPSNDEKTLARKLAKRRPGLFKLFIESLNSSKWLAFLINEGYLNGLLQAKQSNLVVWLDNSVFAKLKSYCRLKTKLKIKDSAAIKKFNEYLVSELLSRHLPKDRAIVLQYLTDLPTFDNKVDFIFWIIFRIEIFDNELGYALLENHREIYKKYSFYYLEIIKHALPYNITWALAILKEYITEALINPDKVQTNSNEYGQYLHHISELYELAVKSDKLQAFYFGVDIVIIAIDQSSYERFKEPGSFYSDSKFGELHIKETHYDGYEKIYQVLYDLTAQLAVESPELFIQFYQRHKDSNSTSLLYLVFHSLMADPKVFIKEIMEFTEILIGKKIIEFYAPRIEHEFKALLNTSYALFPPAFQQKINIIVLSIKSPGELGHRDAAGRKIFTGGYVYGQYQFSFLSAIPAEQRKSYPLIHRLFQQFERKFPKTKVDRTGRSFYPRDEKVSPPAIAYEYFTFQRWLGHFKKTSDKHTYFGRSFQEQVKKRPDYFFQFVSELILCEDLPNDFPIHGIEGLIEAVYDPRKIRLLIEGMLKRVNKKYDVLRIIYCCRYIGQHNETSDDIFSFLKMQATSNEDPAIEVDAKTQYGFNTVRGAAIHEIIQLFSQEKWHDEIMAITEQVADDKITCVRVSVMTRLAYLMNIDKNKTLAIFLKILSDDELVIRSAGWSANYLSYHNFGAMLPYFDKAIECSEETLIAAVTILVHRWTQNFGNSEALLERAVQKGEKAKARAILVASNNIINKEGLLDLKSSQLYDRYLNEDLSKELYHEYSVAFLRFKPADFMTLLPLIKKFAKSNAGQQGLRYYFEYLYGCVKHHPVECLDLIKKIKDLVNVDVSMRVEKDNPIRVVIAIYNRMYVENPTHKNIQLALILFDKLLQIPQHRMKIDSVFESVEN